MPRIASKAALQAGGQSIEPFQVQLSEAQTQTVTFPVIYSQPPTIICDVTTPTGQNYISVVTAVLLQSSAPYTSMTVVLSAAPTTTTYILNVRVYP